MAKQMISLVVLSVLLAAPLAAGEVSGTIKWEGKVPKMKALRMDADPVCANHHQEEPARSEVLVLGEGQTMANVLVRVKSGLPDKKWDPPKEAAVMDQKGCTYVPHVLAVMVNQDIKILNSDGILHNVNVQAKVNRGFNLGMPKGTTEAVRKFSRAEDKIVLKCNVHPWMKAYLVVLDHPFFSVTGKDGAFKIADLAPGTYEIEAWHEKLGTQTAKVTIGSDGDSQTADFTFSRNK
ncbi:Carboxypeptidase regulatory-like domain-containing protein [Sulfidibacter corallicola]|uniref:Rhamnogalacturonan lyase domain-containing protein n=1 Tax=Sulfidibacter corallicola TaxID=2818388 RepID=A0A8A4TI94_SULCO|nr:carboxypeptidase regulatory-like domain-containing protein [Sulfidibacter corallicola]QTD48498.1 hypothetical protein J3U87_23205 [Sulfidibacter corallicola]